MKELIPGYAVGPVMENLLKALPELLEVNWVSQLEKAKLLGRIEEMNDRVDLNIHPPNGENQSGWILVDNHHIVFFERCDGKYRVANFGTGERNMDVHKAVREALEWLRAALDGSPYVHPQYNRAEDEED